MKTFVFFFCGLLAFSAAQQPQICTSTSLEYTASMNGSQLLTYTAILHAQELKGNPMTQIFVTDGAFTSANTSLYYPLNQDLYASVGFDNFKKCYSMGGYCSWLAGNETVQFQLSLNLGNDHGPATVIKILVDENGISPVSGKLFTEDDNCRESPEIAYPFLRYTFRVTQCCKSFKPVPPPLAEYPKCLQFNSSASFYNNGVLFVSVNTTFDATDDGFDISTDSMGPITGSYGVSENGEYGTCGNILGASDNCSVPLPKSDFKVIFPVIVRQPSGQIWQYTVNAGRLISRNGIYEKEEGIRYTRESPCLNQFKLYNNNTIYAFSNFCCSKFAEN